MYVARLDKEQLFMSITSQNRYDPNGGVLHCSMSLQNEFFCAHVMQERGKRGVPANLHRVGIHVTKGNSNTSDREGVWAATTP